MKFHSSVECRREGGNIAEKEEKKLNKGAERGEGEGQEPSRTGLREGSLDPLFVKMAEPLSKGWQY